MADHFDRIFSLLTPTKLFVLFIIATPNWINASKNDQTINCLLNFFFFEYFILSCSRYISTELLAYSYYLYFALLLLLCILSFNSFKHKTRAPVIIVISIIFTCINSIAILLIAKQLLLVVQYFFFFILLLLQLVSAIHRSFFQWI